MLAFDAYYRDLSHLGFEQRRIQNFDHPDSLDHELFARHLDTLRGGEPVDVPEYDFTTQTHTGRSTPVQPRRLVLVEGILLFAFAEIVERMGYSVFLDIPEGLRLQRRVERDVAERGRDPDDVRRQFAETVAPMHDEHVQPHRHRADRVIRAGEPYGRVAVEIVARLAPAVPAHQPG
ncbi:MAG: uridine kinase [Acidimicrobiales bacterium]